MLIPEHHYEGAIVMAAVNVDLAALPHYVRRRLVKCSSTHLTCGETSSKQWVSAKLNLRVLQVQRNI